ncbi:hypothetical protein [Devosia sp. SD17-2]|uniref:hypothetical protein n=1 Tax=Devosia sp. SD17-2 TaxID=2976459 RepID=UPI0023D8035C|nr:hypothetical protein [Devosia sp. SD17-2]WEJ32923.1 hypothetical protein NYQ88_18925 [Devosia sp. SD17-2]
MDASKLGFSAYTFAGNAADTITEASAVAVTTKADLIASATGYKAAVAPSTVLTWGGDLNVTQTGSGAVTLNGDSVALTVKSGTTAVASAVDGEANKLSLTLTNGANSATAPTADTLTTASYTATANVTSLTLSGNGTATVIGGDKLATIDASALGGTLAYGASAGHVTGGLNFTADKDVAESITLGSGTDTITLDVQSTYAKFDTIIGFDATKETNDLKSTTDVIGFGGATLDGAAAAQAAKITLTSSATTLDLAFVEAAAAGTGVSFFQFEGNTYLFSNVDGAALEATDLVAKVVGLVDFSTAWGVYSA